MVSAHCCSYKPVTLWAKHPQISDQGAWHYHLYGVHVDQSWKQRIMNNWSLCMICMWHNCPPMGLLRIASTNSMHPMLLWPTGQCRAHSGSSQIYTPAIPNAHTRQAKRGAQASYTMRHAPTNHVSELWMSQNRLVYIIGTGAVIYTYIYTKQSLYINACGIYNYRMMTSYIKGTARVVNRVPTLRLGQVRWQAPLTPPYMVISISYANNTFQRSPNTCRMFQVSDKRNRQTVQHMQCKARSCTDAAKTKVME